MEGPQNLSELWVAVSEFANAVNWKEPFVVSLISIHVIWFVIIIVLRKNFNIQSVLLFLTLFLMYITERLNRWAKVNWSSFSSDNYFDSSGTFISVIYALPLLVNAITILVNMVVALGSVLIALKRAELRHKRREETKSKNQ